MTAFPRTTRTLRRLRRAIARWHRGHGPFQTAEFPRVRVVEKFPPLGPITEEELAVLYRLLLNSTPPRALITHDQRVGYLRDLVSDQVIYIQLESIRHHAA